MSVARRPRPRRTWPQRLMLGVNFAIVAGALGTAVILAFAKETVSSIPRTAFGGTLSAEEEVIEGESRPPINFLLVGVDSVQNLPADHPLRQSRPGGNTLTDTIIVLRVDPESGQAAAMSIPRDLWVPISGIGRSGKINSALALGGQAGQETLVTTVQEYLDIPIHRFLQVDFNGFLQLIEEIGGLPVFVEYPLRDPKAQFEINETGCVNLTPEQALGYVRTRTLQALIDGRWRVVDGRSDLGRIDRQQDFLVVTLKRAFSAGLTSPSTLKGILDNVVTEGYVSLDDRTTPNDLLQLASDFASFDADDMQRLTLPVVLGTAGSASVVHLLDSEADDVLAVFRGDGDQSRSFRVVVQNGTGEVGRAQEVEFALGLKDFRVIEVKNADSFSYERSVIRYDPAQLDAALELERWLRAGAVLEVRETDLVRTVDLIVGSDWDGVLDAPRNVLADVSGQSDDRVVQTPEQITNTDETEAATPTPTPAPVATIRGCSP